MARPGHLLDADLHRARLAIGEFGPFERRADLVEQRWPASSLLADRPNANGHDAWQQVGKVFGKQARSERRRRSPVQPHCGGRGEKRVHALRQQPEHDELSTSPTPAVASVGGALALALTMTRPSGEAMTMSLPLRTTTTGLLTPTEYKPSVMVTTARPWSDVQRPTKQ